MMLAVVAANEELTPELFPARPVHESRVRLPRFQYLLWLGATVVALLAFVTAVLAIIAVSVVTPG